MADNDAQVQSPCVSNCCLDDKDMCLGCFRMLDDILIWSAASDDKKRTILKDCEQRRLDNPKFIPNSDRS